MTPQEVLVEFEASIPVPVAAIRAALEAKEEMLPFFLKEIESATEMEWEDLTFADSYATMFYILGEWADPRAYLPLVKFLHRDGETLELLLGDTLTDVGDRVIAAVATDDLSPLYELVLDPDADLFPRGAALRALVRIALGKPASRPAIAHFVSVFPERIEADADVLIWMDWVSAVAALGLTALAPKAREVIAASEGDQLLYTVDQFDEDLRETEQDLSAAWFLRINGGAGIDTVAEVSRWHAYSEEGMRERREEEAELMEAVGGARGIAALDGEAEIEAVEGEDVPYLTALEPAHNPFRNVGRNDPCPCGSGKKFKKCCGA